mgnify:CR=1 FL=1
MAAATEELSSTVTEVGRQVARSTEITAEAQTAAEGGVAQMRGLAAAAEQLQPVGHQVEPQPGGDGGHHALVRGIGELDHPAGLHVDQVVVVAVLAGLVAGAAAAEIAAFQDALLLQQPHGAVDGGDRDAGIQGGGATVQFFDIGVVGGL